MRKTPALTTAQLIEARRLIVRAARRDAMAPAEPTPAAPNGVSGDRVLRTAPTNAPKQPRWQPTEWSETAFEPRT
ncbi:MAG: hypothetical protein KGL99_14345 [Burkholderiales bacterium]|nr:hypothetical protein [Burkholderiales bacterium]